MLVTIIGLLYNAFISFIPETRLEILEINSVSPYNNTGLVLYLGSMGFNLFLYVNQKYILEPLSKKIIMKYPEILWL
jgi:hypothetical protein